MNEGGGDFGESSPQGTAIYRGLLLQFLTTPQTFDFVKHIAEPTKLNDGLSVCRATASVGNYLLRRGFRYNCRRSRS